jgi:hypothetical protein
MAGFFILLIIMLLIHYWYVVVGAGALCALWHMVVVPLRERQADLARDRLRHEQARRDIDRIAIATTQAMCEAARGGPEVVDGTVEEWRP